jgi:SAM-dependent methyltransferase
MPAAKNSTARFSNRVDNYIRFRPGYPAEVLAVLEREANLTADAVIADVGSGTGISSKLFLDHGNTVYGGEPNREMRAAAEKLLNAYPRFHSFDGTAEDTPLAENSVDFIIAGQAFHWFDRDKAKREFIRILRPGGWSVLMWNTRRTDTPFGKAYEALLHRFGSDYREIDHRNIDLAAIREFFAPGAHHLRKVDNVQVLDRDGLLGRILSCSYMPTDGHPQFAAMCAAVEQLFTNHQSAGQVRLEYETEFHFGQFQ